MDVTLLASAPDVEGIKLMIAKYWCTNVDRIRLESEKVYQGNQLMADFRVIVKGKRYRFEHYAVQ